jgi:protein-tyrosine phosphatase
MEKGSVLVTCQAGLNRSGIISAMSLIIRGDSPQAAVMMVRMAREHALSNRHFREYLLSLG